MIKTRWAYGLAGTVLLGAAIGGWYLIVATPVATGLAAKQLCSLVFVSRMRPERAIETYIEPLIGPVAPVLSWSVDPATKQVDTDVFGLAQARAVAMPGYGCVQLIDQQPGAMGKDLPPRRVHAGKADAIIVGPDDLQLALTQALAARHTQAVLVARDGAIIGEAYAKGITPNTPLPGWSMAKSVTTTMAGLLQHQGVLSVEDRSLFAGWGQDQRDQITLNQLLRMTSGVAIEETGSGVDANSHMLFKAGDSLAYAVAQPASAAPGERFDYTSGSTVLAAGVIQQHLGGPAATYAWLHSALIDRLGLRSMIMEPDEAGTFIGSSYVMASARDWAALGLLYLRRGTLGETQLFDSAWIDYVTQHTSSATHRPYGAGFWLAHPTQEDSPTAAWPADTYYASGLQHNRLIIVPSRSLIVVRLGASSRYEDSGLDELMRSLLELYDAD